MGKVGHSSKRVLEGSSRVRLVLDCFGKGSRKWGFALDWRISGSVCVNPMIVYQRHPQHATPK
jgi:hypothetical protein